MSSLLILNNYKLELVIIRDTVKIMQNGCSALQN